MLEKGGGFTVASGYKIAFNFYIHQLNTCQNNAKERTYGGAYGKLIVNQK
ncbi:uncharacterized protein DS421_17g588160 [Arachis hypogaea]|nr:uncharacterized protein DS421_17g588160 [Arachis hypogaea]